MATKTDTNLTDVTREVSAIWQAAKVFIWAKGFEPPRYVERLEFITVKPGETGAQAYQREFNEQMPDKTKIMAITG